VIVAALGLVAFGGGFLLANTLGGNDEATVSPTPSASVTTSPSVTPSPSSSPSDSPTPSVTTDPDILEDGQHFVMVTDAGGGEDGPYVVRFDLAYFYTGADAYEYAADHDIEMQNEYLIVNQNPRLRWMPLADDVDVQYIPEGTCCKLRRGSADGFVAAATDLAMTDYPDMGTTWWWFTVEDGEIVSIVQQYLP
jgi:hypothetical protein